MLIPASRSEATVSARSSRRLLTLPRGPVRLVQREARDNLFGEVGSVVQHGVRLADPGLIQIESLRSVALGDAGQANRTSNHDGALRGGLSLV
jgi:hypothetical protein